MKLLSNILITITLVSLYAAPNAAFLEDYVLPDLEADLSIETYIRLVLERVQSFIVDGIPEREVAPKDPVYAGDYFQRWNDTAEVTGGTANIYNMTWTGLRGLTIDAVDFEILNLLGNITLSIPNMHVTGAYSAAGSVNGNPATTATGNFDVHMTEAIFNITLSLGFENATLVVTELVLELVVEKVEVVMSNLVGDPQLEATLQQNAYDLYGHIYSALQAKLAGMSHSAKELLESVFEEIESEDFSFDPNEILLNLKKFAIDNGIPIMY